MNSKEIIDWQNRLREQPKVWFVVYTSGEYAGTDTGNYYTTETAAQLEADWINKIDKNRFGKVRVQGVPMHDLKLSQERWT